METWCQQQLRRDARNKLCRAITNAKWYNVSRQSMIDLVNVVFDDDEDALYYSDSELVGNPKEE